MTETWILSLLHFNLQYCAGGLEELFPDWPADDAALQDQIIEESFVPVLGMLEAHPDWQMDLELQGLMIEVMAERHPDALDRLRALALAGQVELVSFHWSDQLWTAFPWRDQQVSLALTRAAFEDAGLPLSGVVFTQEGQFGAGMLERMPGEGYDVAILPRNLAGYAIPGGGTTLYTAGDVLVVPTNWLSGPDWQMGWHFADDGELYATDGMNCYLGPNFVYDPEALAEKEAELQSYADQGFRIASIGAFAAEVDRSQAVPLPTVVDGTWQPDDTDNLRLWMGGYGLWGADEDDNLVRTSNVRARHAVVAAEQVPGADPARLETAWREVLLSEVSDATGWNPFPTEVRYGLDHAAAAELAALQAVVTPCVDAEADTVTVNVADGVVTWDAPEDTGVPAYVDDPGAALLPGRAGTVVSAPATVDGVPGEVVDLRARFDAGEEVPTLVLPWDGRSIDLVPALSETLASIDPTELAVDPVTVPLSWGLFRGADDAWYVLDTTSVHLAATFDRGAGTVTFLDETAPTEAVEWHLYRAPSEGVAWELARRLNVEPTVTLTCPPRDEPTATEAGCGCAAGPAGGVPALGAAGALVVLGLRARRRDLRDPPGAAQR